MRIGRDRSGDLWRSGPEAAVAVAPAAGPRPRAQATSTGGVLHGSEARGPMLRGVVLKREGSCRSPVWFVTRVVRGPWRAHRSSGFTVYAYSYHHDHETSH